LVNHPGTLGRTGQLLDPGNLANDYPMSPYDHSCHSLLMSGRDLTKGGKRKMNKILFRTPDQTASPLLKTSSELAVHLMQRRNINIFHDELRRYYRCIVVSGIV
jgi:hypothetical protein